MPGVENSASNAFDVHHEIGLSDPDDTDPDTTKGDSGDDMPTWDDDEDIMDNIVRGGTFTNESSKNFPPAVVNVTSNAFDTEHEVSMAEPDGTAEQGSLGDDMPSWADDGDILENIVAGGTVTNESSTSFPYGVMNVVTNAFDTEHEVSMTEPSSNVEEGDRGPAMLSWDDDEDILENIVRGGTFTNLSSQAIPPGTVNTAANGFYVEQQVVMPDIEDEEGIYLGRNVFDLNLFGRVYAVPDPDHPDTENALAVGNATVALQFIVEEDNGNLTAEPGAEVSSAGDGIYAISPPGEDMPFFLQVSHTHLGTFTRVIEIGQTDIEENIFMQLPRGGSIGLNAGGSGVSMG